MRPLSSQNNQYTEGKCGSMSASLFLCQWFFLDLCSYKCQSNQNQKLRTVPLYSHHVQLCLLPSPSPAICSYESVFSLSLALFCWFPSVGWSQRKIKAAGWSLSFGGTQTRGYRKNRRGKEIRGTTRREKTCHVGLVWLPTVRRGFSKKTAVRREHTVADILVHKQRTT